MSQLVIQNNYRPTKKAEQFHSSSAFVQVLLGGMGSGKSRAVINELDQTALEYPGIPMAVYRKTMPALRDSTLKEFLNHKTPGLGDYSIKYDTYNYINESHINFRGLDDPNKAKSTEYAVIVMEEADEFTREDFLFLKGRVRKKGPWPLRIILVFNPVDEDHWLYKEFGDPEKGNQALYEKAGGLLVLHFSTYDNVENLPEGYIEQNTAGMSEDEINRYVHGMWGATIKGEPVYAKILKPEIHMSRWDYTEGMLLLRGWDFGYNHPACSFRLVDQFGRKNCAFSMMGTKEELDIFAKRVKIETELRFPKAVIKDFGDPRGHDKGQSASSTQASTAFEILADCGIHAIGERGSREYVEAGIKEVRREFSTLIQGKPELTIDPSNTLIRTAYLGGKYVRGDDGKPKKDGYYEHIADADRYIPHHYKFSSSVSEAMKAHKERKERQAQRSRYTGY